MMDPRIEPLARNLLGYSLETKPRGSALHRGPDRVRTSRARLPPLSC